MADFLTNPHPIPVEDPSERDVWSLDDLDSEVEVTEDHEEGEEYRDAYVHDDQKRWLLVVEGEGQQFIIRERTGPLVYDTDGDYPPYHLLETLSEHQSWEGALLAAKIEIAKRLHKLYFGEDATPIFKLTE